MEAVDLHIAPGAARVAVHPFAEAKRGLPLLVTPAGDARVDVLVDHLRSHRDWARGALREHGAVEP